MLGIIIGIAIFMFLVVIHELGHFTAAKLSGVKVLEFGIGIPPKVKKLRQDKSGTQYTLNAIPLGGFVRLKGENPQDPSFLAPDSFITANIVKKIIILIAGVTVNAVFAYLVFVYLFATGAQPLIVVPDDVYLYNTESFFFTTEGRLEARGLLTEELNLETVLVGEVFSTTGVATQIGIQKEDIILSINNNTINIKNIKNVLEQQKGNNIAVVIKRGSERMTLKGNCPENNCLLGIAMKPRIPSYQVGLGKARELGLHEIKAQVKLTFQGLHDTIKKIFSFDKQQVKEGVGQLSGPIGAIKIADDIRTKIGYKALLLFAAMISLGLAIFNILPIPALDGGRILGVLIQRISRMKAEKYFLIESYINAFFFVLLLGIGILVIFQDLTKIWGL